MNFLIMMKRKRNIKERVGFIFFEKKNELFAAFCIAFRLLCNKKQERKRNNLKRFSTKNN